MTYNFRDFIDGKPLPEGFSPSAAKVARWTKGQIDHLIDVRVKKIQPEIHKTTYQFSDWKSALKPPKGWDCADAIDAGWTVEELDAFMMATIEDWFPPDERYRPNSDDQAGESAARADATREQQEAEIEEQSECANTTEPHEFQGFSGGVAHFYSPDWSASVDESFDRQQFESLMVEENTGSRSERGKDEVPKPAGDHWANNVPVAVSEDVRPARSLVPVNQGEPPLDWFTMLKANDKGKLLPNRNTIGPCYFNIILTRSGCLFAMNLAGKSWSHADRPGITCAANGSLGGLSKGIYSRPSTGLNCRTSRPRFPTSDLSSTPWPTSTARIRFGTG